MIEHRFAGVAAAVAAAALLAARAFAAPSPELYTDTERRILHSLGCICDTCNHEPLDECKCDKAATMRARAQEQLRGRDLSTAAARDAAYAAVRASLAATYGDAVLTPRPEPKTDARMSSLPVVIFGGGLVLLAVATRRSIRRKRAEQTRPR